MLESILCFIDVAVAPTLWAIFIWNCFQSQFMSLLLKKNFFYFHHCIVTLYVFTKDGNCYIHCQNLYCKVCLKWLDCLYSLDIPMQQKDLPPQKNLTQALKIFMEDSVQMYIKWQIFIVILCLSNCLVVKTTRFYRWLIHWLFVELGKYNFVLCLEEEDCLLSCSQWNWKVNAFYLEYSI